MLGKISGRFVMPEKYVLYKSDAGAEIVFKVDEINDGVYLSDLNAYLITVGVEEKRNKYLLTKTVENNVISLTFAVSKLVTSRSGVVNAQIVFESAGGEVVYHTMLFYISVKNSVSGYAEPNEPLPSAITTLQNSLTATVEQCKELKNDYLAQAEEYRAEKEAINAEIKKLSAHYELIEKIITGYSLLTAEPEDFAENYANYYKTNGKARNDKDFAYVALTEAEPFEAGKYYYKDTAGSKFSRQTEPDGTPYKFSKMTLLFRTEDDKKLNAWTSTYFDMKDENFQDLQSLQPGIYSTGCLYVGGPNAGWKTAFGTFVTDGNSAVTFGAGLTEEGYSYKENTITNTQVFDKKPICWRLRAGAGIFPVGTTIYIYGVRK